MNTVHATAEDQASSCRVFYEESQFWMKSISSWQKVIDRLVNESGEIQASPLITAEVAKVAGQLSLLSERIQWLADEIRTLHQRISDNTISEFDCKREHETLQQRVLREANVLRDLLNEIFRLEQEAYRKFIS